MREDGLPNISRHKKSMVGLAFVGRHYRRDDKVAGIFQMPSAESLATSEVSKGSGHGTWNVPATLEIHE